MEIFDAHTFFGAVPDERADYSLPTLIRELERHGIGAALTFSLKGVRYDAEEGNAETLEALRARAGKGNPSLAPVATIDPRRWLGAGEQIAGWRQAGFRAVRLFPEAQGWPLDYAPLERILAEIDIAGLPVMASAERQGTATQIARLAKRLSVPTILMQVGYWTFAEGLAAAQADDKIHIETSSFATPESLEIAAEAVGAQRLVFGSGLPRRSAASALRMVTSSRLSSGEQALVLGENLKRITGLE
jgi:predicted TIM-barrel fold metal-dependent hydrolase